jgi:hypothetical protein
VFFGYIGHTEQRDFDIAESQRLVAISFLVAGSKCGLLDLRVVETLDMAHFPLFMRIFWARASYRDAEVMKSEITP